jgi:8-oxo-dGTP pyrophosphatase MutT (NUDIX family)
MIAVGALFYAKNTQRVLFLMRNNTRTKNTWGMVSGKLDPNEAVMAGLQREINEELGCNPDILKIIPIDIYTSEDAGFTFYSYIFVIENEFLPILNSENAGYCWVTLDKHPKPLHPGLWNSINTDVISKKIKFIEHIFQ